GRESVHPPSQYSSPSILNACVKNGCKKLLARRRRNGSTDVRASVMTDMRSRSRVKAMKMGIVDDRIASLPTYRLNARACSRGQKTVEMHDVTLLRRQVLALPSHRREDAISSARVIEEDPLLDATGTHLAVFAEVNGRLRGAVGLARGVQAIHVGFALLRADDRVGHGRENKEEERTDESDERKDGRVADAVHSPFRSPTRQRPIERPAQ